MEGCLASRSQVAHCRVGMNFRDDAQCRETRFGLFRTKNDWRNELILSRHQMHEGTKGDRPEVLSSREYFLASTDDGAGTC